MYLHLGQDTVITLETVLGIFDLETTTVSKATRDYLSKATKDHRVVTVSYELPKSFVVCRNDAGGTTVYVSPISPATLLKRSRQGLGGIKTDPRLMGADDK